MAAAASADSAALVAAEASSEVEVAGAAASAAASSSSSAPADPKAAEREFLTKFYYGIHHHGGRDDAKPHKFWDSQPVPRLAETIDRHGPIDAEKKPEDVRPAPFKLPAEFTWVEVDVDDDKQLMELYGLLRDNYVEDDDAMFRFDYKPEFLRWALTAPGKYPDWLLGVRHTDGSLVAFISGIPVNVRVYEEERVMCEINFLCVHKSLREKRLAPVLIKEITRRVNLRDIWQAVYTAGLVIPSPVSQCRYYHRSLNSRKLLEIGFIRLSMRMTMQRMERLNKLPDHPVLPGFRAMTEADVDAVSVLLNEHLSKYKLRLRFSAEETRHWLLPRKGVVSSFVMEAADTKAIVAFSSYYHLPSTVLHNPKHSDLQAAYSFYTVPPPEPHTLVDLFRDTLVAARNEGLDVFNALHLMDNATVFKDLRFGAGDGLLNFYLYNWACPKIDPSGVGIVLL